MDYYSKLPLKLIRSYPLIINNMLDITRKPVVYTEASIADMFEAEPKNLLNSLNDALVSRTGEYVDTFTVDNYRQVQSLGLKALSEGNRDELFEELFFQFLTLFNWPVPQQYHNVLYRFLGSDNDKVRTYIYRLIRDKKMIFDDGVFVIDFQRELQLFKDQNDNFALDEALEVIRELRVSSLKLLIKTTVSELNTELADVILSLQKKNDADTVRRLIFRKSRLEQVLAKLRSVFSGL